MPDRTAFAGPTPSAVVRGIERLVERSFLYVHLEPTNACNTRCAMCPREAMTRPLRLMSWPVFERVMALLLPSDVPMLSLVGFGEPTLHPRLSEMLAYVRERRPDMVMKITTNGSRLSDRLLESLFTNGLDLLELSVVGIDQECYRHAMGGLEFSECLDLVGRLNANGYHYMLTTFATRGLDPDRIEEYWRGRGVEHIAIKGFHRRGGYLNEAELIAIDGLGRYQQRRLTQVPSCEKLSCFTHITVEGDVIPCVQEINRKNVITTIDRVASISDLRALIDAERPVYDICDGCPMPSQDLIGYYAKLICEMFPALARRLAMDAAE